MLIALALCCAPCADPPKTEEGGALVQSTRPAYQALTAEDRERLFAISPATVERIDEKEPLNLTDIIVMSQLGISTGVIISQIERTESSFSLSQDEVGELSEAGVNQEVIDYLLDR